MSTTSHDTIWLAIDLLAERAGFSTSGLARRAGLDPTAFNRSKRVSPEGKPRWPSMESVAKVLMVTGSSMNDFATLVETHELIPVPQNPTLPLISLSEALGGQYFDATGTPIGTGWDEINFPAGLNAPDDNSYALEIQGDALKPLYRDGDILILSPTAPMRKGDRILAKLRQGHIAAGELSRRSLQRLELKSFLPPYDDLTFANDDILWVARILWASQ